MKKALLVAVGLVGVLSFVGCSTGYDSTTDMNYPYNNGYKNGYYNNDYDGNGYYNNGYDTYNGNGVYNGYSTYNGNGANNTVTNGMNY